MTLFQIAQHAFKHAVYKHIIVYIGNRIQEYTVYHE